MKLFQQPASPLQSSDGFRKWSIAITLFLGTLSVGLSVTAVNIAIPTMMSSFGVSLNRIQWVLTGFMITRTVLIPCVGWLGDRIGDRNVFILSTTLFTAGSLLCSLSWNTESLIFFRIIQGIGAGPLLGVAMAIMFEAFPRNERGLAMGLFMTGWSLGPFFGPLLGGYLAEHVHWRAIFYINLPTGVLSILAGYYILPRTKSHAAPAPLDGCRPDHDDRRDHRAAAGSEHGPGRRLGKPIYRRPFHLSRHSIALFLVAEY